MCAGKGTGNHPICKLSVEVAGCEAVFRGDEWSISMFRADFPASTSKSVEVVPKLPNASQSKGRIFHNS